MWIWVQNFNVKETLGSVVPLLPIIHVTIYCVLKSASRSELHAVWVASVTAQSCRILSQYHSDEGLRASRHKAAVYWVSTTAMRGCEHHGTMLPCIEPVPQRWGVASITAQSCRVLSQYHSDEGLRASRHKAAVYKVSTTAMRGCEFKAIPAIQLGTVTFCSITLANVR